LRRLRKRQHTRRMVEDAERHEGAIGRLLSRLHEVEETLEHEVIEWSERDAIEVQKRLDALSTRIGAIMHRLQGQR
jgi:hypothetical protein